MLRVFLVVPPPRFAELRVWIEPPKLNVGRISGRASVGMSGVATGAAIRSDAGWTPRSAARSGRMKRYARDFVFLARPSMWPFSSSKAPAPAAPPAADGDATQLAHTQSFDTQAPEVPAEAPTAASLLRNTALDPTQLHPLASMGDDLEYLDIEEAQASQLEGARTALPSRGWTDDLCYGTGTSYLGGLIVGGVLGVREGLSRPLGVDSPTTRLRMNAVLNQVTRRGTFLGNSAGVIAMTYNLFDAAIDASRGKHDIYGSLAAGALSGALYNSTNGLRAMAVSSAVMMGAAATWTGFKKAFL